MEEEEEEEAETKDAVAMDTLKPEDAELTGSDPTASEEGSHDIWWWLKELTSWFWVLSFFSLLCFQFFICDLYRVWMLFS